MKVTYNFIMETVAELTKRRYGNGVFPQMGDTVCAVLSGSGKVYTGINQIRINGNFPENIHAEIDAVYKMRSEGETVIKALTLFDSFNNTTILPCNGCINLIVSLNSENTGAEVVTPTGNIRITDIGVRNPQKSYAGPGTFQGGSTYMNSGAVPVGSQYTNPGTLPGTVFFSSASSAFSSQRSMNQGPVHKSYASGGGVKNGNNLMKNKLSSLFDDDE